MERPVSNQNRIGVRVRQPRNHVQPAVTEPVVIGVHRRRVPERPRRSHAQRIQKQPVHPQTRRRVQDVVKPGRPHRLVRRRVQKLKPQRVSGVDIQPAPLEVLVGEPVRPSVHIRIVGHGVVVVSHHINVERRVPEVRVRPRPRHGVKHQRALTRVEVRGQRGVPGFVKPVARPALPKVFAHRDIPNDNRVVRRPQDVVRPVPEVLDLRTRDQRRPSSRVADNQIVLFRNPDVLFRPGREKHKVIRRLERVIWNGPARVRRDRPVRRRVVCSGRRGKQRRVKVGRHGRQERVRKRHRLPQMAGRDQRRVHRHNVLRRISIRRRIRQRPVERDRGRRVQQTRVVGNDDRDRERRGGERRHVQRRVVGRRLGRSIPRSWEGGEGGGGGGGGGDQGVDVVCTRDGRVVRERRRRRRRRKGGQVTRAEMERPRGGGGKPKSGEVVKGKSGQEVCTKGCDKGLG